MWRIVLTAPFVFRDYDEHPHRDNAKTVFLGVPVALDGTHFGLKCFVSEDAAKAPGSHASQMECLHCELPDLLERRQLPDEEMLDLIEQAFLEGQIDGEEMNRACLLLDALSRNGRVGVGISRRQ